MTWIGQPEWPAERLWLWQAAFPPVRALAGAIVPVEVHGSERVPRERGCILAANHVSWYDPPALEFGLGIPIRWMAKREVFEWPLLGGVLRGIGCFPVRRGEADRRALETALRVLAAGRPLGFFPEGTRSRDGRLRRAKPGIGFLARQSGVPLVPIAIEGTYGISPGLRPARVRISVGEPFRAEDLGTAGDQAVADEVMRRIAALLPSQMRDERALPTA